MSDPLGLIFGALADPTRRQVVETLLSADSTSVPELTGRLPITRQAVAKHLHVLDEAGLIERIDLHPSGREVRYRLRDSGLREAAGWLQEADRAWERRLRALKRSVEGR